MMEVVVSYHHPAGSILVDLITKGSPSQLIKVRIYTYMVVKIWELAKFEKYRHLFMKDGLIHDVS